MSKGNLSARCAGILFLASLPLFAHHPFSSEFDASKPMTLNGTVTKVLVNGQSAKALSPNFSEWEVVLNVQPGVANGEWTSVGNVVARGGRGVPGRWLLRRRPGLGNLS